MFEFQKEESERIQKYQEWLYALSNQDLYKEWLRLDDEATILDCEKVEVCQAECVERFKMFVELEINGPVF